MNKRIRKCLREEDVIDKKIAELQSQKADIEIARGQEEDKEIIRIIRGMNLEKHDLADLLDGLKSGKISLLEDNDFLDEGEGSTDASNVKTAGAREHAPESEADNGGQAIE